MAEYPTTWVDYRLPTGQEFSVGVCGYSGCVRHMFLGNDFIRRTLIRCVNVDGTNCTASQYCLALDCPLNGTPREHLLHMLDMPKDEPVDAETSRLWGTESALDCLLQFAEKMNQSLPRQLQQESKNLTHRVQHG